MSERTADGRSQEQALIGRLQQAPVFQCLAGRYLQVLRRIARPRTLAPGATVIEAGEAGPGLFILLKGTWAVGDSSDHVLEPISTAGEIAELTEAPQALRIGAVEDSIALHIPHDVLSALFSRDADLHQRLCRNAIMDLSQRLVASNSRLDRLGEERATLETDLAAIEMELNDARMLQSMRV